jgi:hypothetical protein
MSQSNYRPGPLSFEIAKWLGYGFSAMFILVGGVQIILGVLDRNYEAFPQWFIFLLFGIALLVIAFAFRDQKKWGWTVMLVLSALATLGAAVQLRNFSAEGLILLVLCLATLGALLAPDTRTYVDRRP